MTSTNCLDCGKELTDKFCAGCGQKADTHRISFRHFILHDVMHGVFHFERGILFTAKQALIRPGKASLDYIAGKRKRYYNVFYLILITFGLIIFLRHFYDQLYIATGGISEPERPFVNEASKTIDGIISQKSKLIIFLFVPLAALNSRLLFRRKKLNLSEHSIIAGMILLGMLLLSALGNLLFYFTLLAKDSDVLSNAISICTPLLIILYIGYGYYNAFSKDYSKPGVIYRIMLLYLLTAIEILILFYLLMGFVTHWKFGEVSISPFG